MRASSREYAVDDASRLVLPRFVAFAHVAYAHRLLAAVRHERREVVERLPRADGLVGLEEARVGREQVAAHGGLLIDDLALRLRRGRDDGVRVVDPDGVRAQALDLEVEQGPRRDEQHERRHEGDQEALAEGEGRVGGARIGHEGARTLPERAPAARAACRLHVDRGALPRRGLPRPPGSEGHRRRVRASRDRGRRGRRPRARARRGAPRPWARRAAGPAGDRAARAAAGAAFASRRRAARAAAAAVAPVGSAWARVRARRRSGGRGLLRCGRGLVRDGRRRGGALRRGGRRLRRRGGGGRAERRGGRVEAPEPGHEEEGTGDPHGGAERHERQRAEGAAAAGLDGEARRRGEGRHAARRAGRRVARRRRAGVVVDAEVRDDEAVGAVVRDARELRELGGERRGVEGALGGSFREAAVEQLRRARAAPTGRRRRAAAAACRRAPRRPSGPSPRSSKWPRPASIS